MNKIISFFLITIFLAACSNTEVDTKENLKSISLKEYGYNANVFIDDKKYENIEINENYYLEVNLNSHIGFTLSIEEYNQQFELANPGLGVYVIEIIQQDDKNLIYKKTLKSGGEEEYAFYLNKDNGLVSRNQDLSHLSKTELEELLRVVKNIESH